MSELKPTDNEIIEVLATKVNLKKCMHNSISDCWIKPNEDHVRWNPFTDLNACHEVEDRLTVNQKVDYVNRLGQYLVGGDRTPTPQKYGELGLFAHFCHVPAHVKAEALWRVLKDA